MGDPGELFGTEELSRRSGVEPRRLQRWHKAGILVARWQTPGGLLRWCDEDARLARRIDALCSVEGLGPKRAKAAAERLEGRL